MCLTPFQQTTLPLNYDSGVFIAIHTMVGRVYAGFCSHHMPCQVTSLISIEEKVMSTITCCSASSRGKKANR